MKKYNQLPRKGRTFEGSEPSGMTIWISQLHKKPWPVCIFHQVHHGHTTSHAPWTSSGQHPLASVSTTSHILSQEVLISAFGGSGGPFKFLALSAFTLLPSGSKLHLLLQCCLEGFIKFHLPLSQRMGIVGKKENTCQLGWGKALQTVVRITFPWKIIKSYAAYT